VFRLIFVLITLYYYSIGTLEKFTRDGTQTISKLFCQLVQLALRSCQLYHLPTKIKGTKSSLLLQTQKLEKMGGAGNEEEAVVESKEWYLAAYAPEGVPTSDHLKLRTVPLSLRIDSIPDHHLIVQNLLISVDPYHHAQMTGLEDGLYSPQFKLNVVL
jgi:hypothetical protein